MVLTWIQVRRTTSYQYPSTPFSIVFTLQFVRLSVTTALEKYSAKEVFDDEIEQSLNVSSNYSASRDLFVGYFESTGNGARDHKQTAWIKNPGTFTQRKLAR